ncbi:ran-binding protein 3-like [Ornithodoros turicata]|uniref:Putative ran-binding protein ranbp3 n=1 Tax=Ornithodoros turicata TaxID=34597 RepID=A0A2R5LBN8_9ACAR
MAEKGANPGNGDTGLVSSSCLASSTAGMVGLPRISQNPFAIKTTTPTRSVADSTDNKESKPIVAPPTLVLGSDNAVSSSASKVVLRPSPLEFQAEKLKLTNASALENSGSEEKDAARDGKEVSSTCEPMSNGTTNDSSSQSESNSVALDVKNGSRLLHAEMPSSGLLNSTLDDSTSPNPAAPPPEGFVFGENLRERASNYDEGSLECWPSVVSPQSELTFEQIQNTQPNPPAEEATDLSASAANKQTKSLTESAEEYQSRQVKRRYDEVTVVTGEENESNVLQINCKLFTFDKTASSWQERGRGNLRLNDREVEGVLQSRLVMRTQGSLRVILNTKVWSGMVVEHPSSKTVQTSAIDPDGIRVYLIQANAKDAEQLFSALDWRVATLKSAEENNPSSSASAYHLSSTQSSADSSSFGGVHSPAKRQRINLPDSSGDDHPGDDADEQRPSSECDSSAEDKG